MDGKNTRGMSEYDERYILYYFAFDYINRFTRVWQVGLVFFFFENFCDANAVISDDCLWHYCLCIQYLVH